MPVVHAISVVAQDLRRRVRHWRANREYARGYSRYPETEEESAGVEATSDWVLLEEECPWEDDAQTDDAEHAN